MSQMGEICGTYKNGTQAADVQVFSGNGSLIGFYVNSTTSGTLVFYEGTTTSGTVISGTITPAIGWHFFPVSVGGGLFCDTGGTINVTFIYRKML